MLPGLIRRLHEAAQTDAPTVTFGALASRDASSCTLTTSRACVRLLENYDEPEPINVGVGGACPSTNLPRWSRRDRRVQGRTGVQHHQTGRHAAQAARHVHDSRGRLERAD